MTKSGNAGQRHFPYKHPTFGSKARPKPESAWQRSIYYWWWAYLRRNESYLATCDLGGGGEMATLYQDFGDVRGGDFKAWWRNHGVHLFAEPTAEDAVRIISDPSALVLDGSALTLSLPLWLPKRHLEKRIRDLLGLHHKGKRGHQLAKKSRARYQVQGQPNIPALKQGLAVYDHWKANPGMPLWRVGNTLPRFQLEHRIAPGERMTAAKKNVLAATVSRYLRRVRRSIESVGKGYFP